MPNLTAMNKCIEFGFQKFDSASVYAAFSSHLLMLP